MKKLFTFLLASAFFLGSYAQDESPMEIPNLTANNEGDIIIDVYYGYINKDVWQATITKAPNGKTSTIGPTGARIQYMASDNFGIGVDISFQKRSGTWSDTYSQWNSTTNSYENIDYNATYSTTKIKAMIRTSWEFVNTEKFTMNWANSFGYKQVSRIWTDPYNEFDLSGLSIPLAIRSALGVRFYFTDNIAIHAEGGVFGGGLLLGGVSIKL